MAASWGYFDTSVLVKRYVREEGSQKARELLRRRRVVCSAIAPLEALSAFGRRRAANEISAHSFDAIVARLQSDREHFELVEVNVVVLGRAEEVIRKAGVRTLDAVHIACALVFQELSGRRVPFITADDRQRDAAQQFGLALVWVD